MSTVWEYTGGCSNQYMGDLDIHLITLLSYLYGVIMDRTINTPGHGKIVLMGLMLLTNVI